MELSTLTFLPVPALGSSKLPAKVILTTSPFTKSQVFSTAADNQTAVDIHVLQGERQFARDNKTLGRFELVGIAPAPRGIPQIEVTFDIDANGIVSVRAMDKATNKSQSITITASSNLTEDDINAAVKDAEKYAEEDMKRKALIDAKNDAEQLILAMDKFVSENGDKIEDADKDTLKEAVETARKDFETAETEEAIRGIIVNMTTVSDPIITKFYQQNPDVMAETMRNAGIDPDSVNVSGGDNSGVDGTID